MGTEDISPTAFSGLKKDVEDVKRLMEKMVDAIQKIGLLDERQKNVNDTVQKMSDRLDERDAKMSERLDKIEGRLHEADIYRALNQSNSDRINAMEKSVSSIVTERDKDLARLQVVSWGLKAIWVIVAAGGISIIAKLDGLF